MLRRKVYGVTITSTKKQRNGTVVKTVTTSRGLEGVVRLLRAEIAGVRWAAAHDAAKARANAVRLDATVRKLADATAEVETLKNDMKDASARDEELLRQANCRLKHIA